jgi:hypothetical protein
LKIKKPTFNRFLAVIVAAILSMATAGPAHAKDFCIDNDEFCKLTSSAAAKPKSQKNYLGNCSDINGFSTGYDRFLSLAIDTEYGNNVLTRGSKTNVELTLSLNCAMDTDYLPRLILSKGISSRLIYLNPSDFTKQNSLDFPIKNFCYTNSCYLATYTGELEIPADAALGDYTLKLSVVPAMSNKFSNASSSFTYTSGITVKSSYYEEPKKIEASLTANNEAGYAFCYMDEISREAIDYYGISATQWTVSLKSPKNKTTVLDKFEIPVQSSTSAEQKITELKNGYSGLYLTDGGIVYAYTPYKQTKGATLICSSTVKATSGDWATLTKSTKMPRTGKSIQ